MSAIHPVTLPKWGLEMHEGTIAAWHVAEGAAVEKGADLVDIETDKIVNTLDAERAGTVRRLLAAPGDVLPVGALIAVLAPPAVAEAEVNQFIASYRPIDASFDPGERGAEAAPVRAETPAARTAAAAPVPPEELQARNATAHATPVARRVATQLGIDLAEVTGSSRNGRVAREDVERAAAARGMQGAGAAVAAPRLSTEALRAVNDTAYASPVARKVAMAIGLDISALKGTGARGRISLHDVRTEADGAGLQTPKLAQRIRKDPAPVEAKTARTPDSLKPPADASLAPFTGMRKSIAQAMARAKQSVPHFYTTMDIDMDALLALRTSVTARGGSKISVNDFILRASALSLAAHPEVNVHVYDDGIQSFGQADIAMAVAIEGGLMTPVVRDVGAKSVNQIARETAALAEKARTRTLAADEIRGATFTVSNLGMFGVRQFDAIVMPPAAAILAVGNVRREAREVNSNVTFVSVMSVTLSADHRAVDGATVARFLATLRDIVQDPLSLMM
jgi:pyruvate dehydrogenase E2 component (dihydrolipoamide acetyltransferase)